MNKILFLLLLTFSSLTFSTEIYNIKAQNTGLIINGIGLKKINKIKLGNKFLKIERRTNNYILAICKTPNKIPCSNDYYLNEGTYLLQIYKNKIKPHKELFINIPKPNIIITPNISPGFPILPPNNNEEPGLPILP